METRFITSRLYQLSALLFLVFMNSCSFPGKFPLTVEDIDTLTIYKRHFDSLNVQKIIKVSDSLIIAPEMIKKELRGSIIFPEQIVPENKWTICTGTFKIKSNAERKFLELSKQYRPYLIDRQNLYYVCIGLFTSKDSANQFRNDTAVVFENYIMKISHKDKVHTMIASK